MNRWTKAVVALSLFAFATGLPTPQCAAAPAGSPAAQIAKEDQLADLIMGEYVGELALGGKTTDALAQVYPTGKGGYKAAIMRGLWGQEKADKPLRIELSGTAEGDTVKLAGKHGGTAWTGKVVGGKTLTAEAGDGKGKFEGKFTVRESPTLGAEPPKGAIVLLAFEAGKPPSLDGWTNKKWRALPTGAVEVRGGNTNSVKKLGSCKLHVEFRCPYQPSRKGQGRGNSGVYLQRRYEIQVLDSFGLVPRKGDCAAIYGVAVPKINASLPPTTWQTYDVEFLAAKPDQAGKVVRPPTFKSVRHNGVLIHENVEVKGRTRAAQGTGTTPADSLMLQDHGNKVQYRNIWAVPLEE